MSTEKEGLDRTIVPCAGCRNEASLSEANIAEVVNYADWSAMQRTEQQKGADYLPELGTRKR